MKIETIHKRRVLSLPLLIVPVFILLFAGETAFGTRAQDGAGQSHRQPLALAAADLDGDGMPDLIEAYSESGTGHLLIKRGNVDALFPNTPEAQERRRLGTFTSEPFLAPLTIISLPIAPDFAAAADFNADGRNDLLAASHGDNAFLWLMNEGEEGFRLQTPIPLNGRLTALIAADINRRDGLPEVIAGVSRKDGDFLAIFESPEGAIRAEPEEIAMPGPIARICAGQLDGDYPQDLVVLTGDTLALVHGRDRKLSQSPRRQAEVSPAEVTVLALPFAGSGVAVGDFLWTPDYREEIAVLSEDGRQLALIHCSPGGRDYNVHTVRLTGTPPLPESSHPARMTRARVSGLLPDDLIIVQSGANGVYVIPGAPAGSHDELVSSILRTLTPAVDVLPMRLYPDPLHTLVLLHPGGAAPLNTFVPAATLTVNSTLDLPDGNVNDGICDTGNATIGFTGICTLRAAIQTANVIPGLDRIHFAIGGGGNIEPATNLPGSTGPLVVDGTTEPGYAGTPRIELSGVRLGDNGDGLSLTNDSTVRGIAVNRFKQAGIRLTSNSIVESCMVGTDPLGQFARGNGRGTMGLGGIVARGSNNFVGGTVAAARNIISANGNAGVQFEGTFNVSENNTVQGNYLGLDSTGIFTDFDNVPNSGDEMGNTVGVTIVGATARDNLVGGILPNERNVIAGSEFNHVRILQGIGNRVQGNYLGTNRLAAGSRTGSGFSGVFISDGRDNTLGGSTPDARNLIVRGGVHGVLIQGTNARGNKVQANHIGTDLDGVLGMPNSANGIRIEGAPTNTVGGIAVGTRNVISANGQNGIEIANASARGNEILGNYIGMAADGSDPLSNNLNGVRIFNAPGNFIGDQAASARNIISANFGSGIEISGSGATGNVVQSNFIGTDVDGQSAQGNTLDGVRILGNAANNVIGGSPLMPGAVPGNIISGNRLNGVSISGNQTSNNQVAGNLIGLRPADDAPMPNRENGVFIENASSNTIGGSQAGERNILSGNKKSGILITGMTAFSNAVFGNYIGLNVDGTQTVPNELNGVRLQGSQANLIGGPGQLERNVISGHAEAGVLITGGQGHALQNNHIGVNPAGNAAMPNLIGVAIENSDANAIGLPVFGGGNVISGNILHGVQIFGDTPGGGIETGLNTVVNNSIGTDLTGVLNLGNGLHGVGIFGIAEFNTVGSTGIGGFNRIAFNGGAGVARPANDEANGILVNYIYSNDELGIDVGDDGLTLNNAGPEDNIVNFPIIDSAIYDGMNTLVSGRLRSYPDRRFLLVFFVNDDCDPSFHGEGQRPVISLEANTDENGLLTFSENLPGTSAPIGSFITLTASARHALPPGFFFWETSEFSRCVPVAPPCREADINCDGCVDDADLLAVLFAFGQTCSNCPEDLNHDGVVDDADLLMVLFNFGEGC
jgi:CSLREA domain-containing protein